MEQESNRILTSKQVYQKIRRIAHEIYESNFKENTIIFAGIDGNGYSMAEHLKKEYQAISNSDVRLIKVSLDKNAPLQSEIKLDVDPEALNDQVVILVDDVLNTGRTLAYSLKPFLSCVIKRLQTAVMVDRGYTTFPIAADYVGYALSTTIQEHVSVQIVKEGLSGVYLY